MSKNTNEFEEIKRIQEVYRDRDDRDEPRYSMFSPSHLFMVHERQRQTLRLLSKKNITHLQNFKILDLGCGRGDWLLDLISWGASPENLFGLDLMHDRLTAAADRCAQGVKLINSSATQIPLESESLDLIIQSTVFTSILDGEVKNTIASEMNRILKSGASVLWYDFKYNNPMNKDVKGVGKSEIYQLFPGWKISLVPLTLLPPLSRKIAPKSTLIAKILETFPPLCSHLLGWLTKP